MSVADDLLLGNDFLTVTLKYIKRPSCLTAQQKVMGPEIWLHQVGPYNNFGVIPQCTR